MLLNFTQLQRKKVIAEPLFFGDLTGRLLGYRNPERKITWFWDPCTPQPYVRLAPAEENLVFILPGNVKTKENNTDFHILTNIGGPTTSESIN